MTLRTMVPVLALLVLSGCQQLQPAPVPAPVQPAPMPETDTADRASLAYALMDAPFAKLKLDTSVPVKVVVDMRLGSKEIVYKDWFFAGKGFLDAKSVVVGLRPVDNGELSKARRIRYGIQTADQTVTHLVRNPFLGLTVSPTAPPKEIKSDGKPVIVFAFSKADLKAPASALAAIVRIAAYKATKEELAKKPAVPLIEHQESPWGKKKS